MAKRFLSIWFPKLPIDRHARQSTLDCKRRACAIIEQTGNRQVITHVSGPAKRAGIVPGMTLGDALAVYPMLSTWPTEPVRDRHFLKSLARYCYRYSPLVAFEPPENLVLDVTGCSHLFGGEVALCARIREDFFHLGLTAHTGLAPTPGAARALTRAGVSDIVIAPCMIRLRAQLAGLPVHALGLEPDMCAVLNRLGLGMIGSLYAIARSQLRHRFGDDLTRRLYQALGAEPEPLKFLHFIAPYEASRRFAEPLCDMAQIAAAARLTLAALCRRLESRAMGARTITLTVERTGDTRQIFSIGLARPGHDPGHIFALLEHRLDKLEAQFGIDGLSVAAPRIEPMTVRTGTLLENPGIEHDTGARAGLIDRLANKLGFDNVVVSFPAETHIPEHAARAHPAQYADGMPKWRHGGKARPVLLYRTPVLLAGFTMKTFTLNGTRHRITQAEGPERIVPEWWWDDPAWRSGARDYWWIETEDATRLWVFRDMVNGRHCWKLHGLGA